MKNHFDKNLGVRDMILMKRPEYIVELGAADGQNTRQILSLMDIYEFKMTTISTGGKPSDIQHDNFEWINGVSFKEVPTLQDNIGFCTIDTDHNYWTLKSELEALLPKLAENCLVVMHDTETYGLHDGIQFGYDGKDMPTYPEEITKCGKQGLQTALNEFLVNNKEFRLIKHVSGSCGATAIGRGNVCE